MSLDPNNKDGTKVIQFGKFSGVLYPDIYFKFVTELHNNHPDLIRAMVFAKVKLEDGSARDFLNQTFNTAVPKNAPMEEGYKVFYYALLRRTASNAEQNILNKIVSDHKSGENANIFKFRPEEETGKPLFPSMEEMTEKGMK